MKLKNFTKRMIVVTLPHAEVCVENCYCTATVHSQTVHNPKTGDVGIRQFSILVPMSLHIPAGAVTADLPDEILNSRSTKATNGLRKVS